MEERTKRYYVKRPASSRDSVLADAVVKCLDTLYKASYPSISYKDLCEESKKLKDSQKPETGVYDLHYLPHKVCEEIVEDFVDAYRLKSDLPDTIEILKGYFKEPIVDKYVEPEDGNPGYRDYDHPEPMSQEHYEVVSRFLDMANRFYKWNRDERIFRYNVYDVSPSGNREIVEKWYHEHEDPDFKIPEDSYWYDPWTEENDDYGNLEFVNDLEEE